MNQLTDKQDLSLKNFSEILIFGNDCLSKVEIHPYKIRPKKYILFCTMIAVQSYSEAILKLMKPDNIYSKAAEILMRSLVEAYINLNYVYSDRTKKNAMLFILESENDKIDFAKKHQTLWKKYPKWKLEFGTIKKIEDWNKFFQDKHQLLKKIEKKYDQPLSKLPNILDRAIAFDKQYKQNKKLPQNIILKRLERKSLEKYYILYYKYFSQIAHLTMPGLEQFIRIDQNGKTWIYIDGETVDIERIVPITFIIYMAILAHFLKQFKLYDKSTFEKFKKMSKIMEK